MCLSLFNKQLIQFLLNSVVLVTAPVPIQQYYLSCIFIQLPEAVVLVTTRGFVKFPEAVVLVTVQQGVLYSSPNRLCCRFPLGLLQTKSYPVKARCNSAASYVRSKTTGSGGGLRRGKCCTRCRITEMSLPGTGNSGCYGAGCRE